MNRRSFFKALAQLSAVSALDPVDLFQGHPPYELTAADIQWGVNGLLPLYPDVVFEHYQHSARPALARRVQFSALDPVCSHGTALDVHCCDCHSGFLFDLASCRCGDRDLDRDRDRGDG